MTSCDQWLPAQDKHCGRNARQYPEGHWRCPDHTPARQRGHPEPPDPQEKR